MIAIAVVGGEGRGGAEVVVGRAMFLYRIDFVSMVTRGK